MRVIVKRVCSKFHSPNCFENDFQNKLKITFADERRGGVGRGFGYGTGRALGREGRGREWRGRKLISAGSLSKGAVVGDVHCLAGVPRS